MEYIKQFFKIKIENGKIIFLDKKEKSSSMTKERTFKIYVFKKDAEVWYIGITSQRISKRFELGMKGSKGYSGYEFNKKKFGEIGKILDVLIFTFNNCRYAKRLEKDKNGKNKLTDEYQELLNKFETIEGELVYEYKKDKGQWPKYQHEIHFRNSENQEIKGLVKKIYKEIINYKVS